MNILFLRGFNNYFNRTLKKYSSLDDYKSNSISYLNYSNINFNPNDGVVTELIVGNYSSSTGEQTENSGEPLNFDENGAPDYAVCYEGTTIKSRWFVLESERTRAGQYRIALKRDVIADFYNNIKNAPCFIEKGMVSESTNPLLYNKENMILNQIKKDQQVLKDKSDCAWVVGYIPGDFSKDSNTTITTTVPFTGTQDITVNGLSNWDYYSYYSNKYSHSVITTANVKSNFVGVQHQSTTGRYQNETDINTNVASDFTWHRGGTNNTNVFNPKFPFENVFMTQLQVVYTYVSANPSRAYYLKQDSEGTWASSITSLIDGLFQSNQNLYNSSTIISTNTIRAVESLNNKVLYDASNSKYYKILVKYSDTNSGIRTGVSTVVRPELTMYTDFVNNWASRWGTNAIVAANYTSKNIYIELVEQVTSIKTVIPTNRYSLQDSPYDMFCIPYSVDTQVNIESNGTRKVTNANREAALRIATAIGKSCGDGAIYDIQLLPYCPVQNILTDTPGLIDYGDLIVSEITSNDESNTKYNTLFWCSNSNFSFDINHIVEIPDYGNWLTSLKVSNECDLWRLCSPNWSGQFDFMIAKMGGFCEGFNVDCSYKPFQPYIHINPKFSFLYGTDWDDARGLICGGDFSLPQLSNSWANYTLNNKNYQNIFDREMLNLQRNQQIQKENQVLNSITGIVTGGVGGAVTGGMAGGGIPGAIAGAVIGTGASIAGAALDWNWMERQQREAKSYKTDMYNYNLGNIQAIPTSISKVSSFTLNNKIFPVLEYYSCTDEEKEIVLNKIKYDGMTIMAISTINNYSTYTDFDRAFVRGDLIRLDGIADDFHIADAIYQEVKKGFYIPQ